MFYIIANFKSNLVEKDYIKYIDVLSRGLQNISVFKDLNLVLCPPLLYSNIFTPLTKKYSYISIGAQNVSKFAGGPYTGEINVEQIKDYCKFCIVGHSERRQNFNEKNEEVLQKVSLLSSHKITPIVCISNLSEYFEKNVGDNFYFAYEPIESISTNKTTSFGAGKIASIVNVEDFCNKLQLNNIIYGGSVTDENLDTFVLSERILGLLIGGASLNPISLLKIIKKTSKLLKLK